MVIHGALIARKEWALLLFPGCGRIHFGRPPVITGLCLSADTDAMLRILINFHPRVTPEEAQLGTWSTNDVNNNNKYTLPHLSFCLLQKLWRR